MTQPAALAPEALRRASDPSAYAFESTADLEPADEPPGQERAMDAARLAMAVERPGYHLLAVGPPGVGKHRTLLGLLRRMADGRPRGQDYCYVYNFESPGEPQPLALPAGRGRELKEDMARLLEDLRAAIPAAFDSEEFRARAQEIHDELNEKAEAVFEEVEADAKRAGVKMLRTPAGVAFVPTINGQVLSPEGFEKLPEEERKRTRAAIEQLQSKLQKMLRQVPRWAKEARNRLRELSREVSRYAVGQSNDELKERYRDLPAVERFLQAVMQDVVDNAEIFRSAEETAGSPLDPGDSPFRRYRVNLLVDHSTEQGAPVVYEDNPTLDHLFGRIGHRIHLGNLVSDFNLIRAGALHRANGGYLVLDARKVLMHAASWQALKRALFAGEIRIESLSRILGLDSTVPLEPAPIPLDVKVVLIADRELYALLTLLDSEVADLFKVTADFNDRMDRSPAGELAFARLVTGLVRQYDLKPLDAPAVGRVVEHSARMAGDGAKLSINQRLLGDLLVEADHVAGGAARIGEAHVQQAIDMQIRRHERVRERIYETIADRTLLVDTTGERTGQVNGLWVRAFGGFAFGAPARITATARVGKGEVIDIEREAKLGGSIHSKGVLILTSYFASRFARSHPLSLHASLVFEQSYAGVEGDSASLAELCALLSALSGLPVRQSLAVTGSVNQLGVVQAIGGVNEKIEGFFEVCRLRGLDGQGVIIPASNVRHLMLRREVVEACREGSFAVFAVERADDAIGLLTGVDAGREDEQGRFPADSVNGRVLHQLREFTRIAASFSRISESDDST